MLMLVTEISVVLHIQNYGESINPYVFHRVSWAIISTSWRTFQCLKTLPLEAEDEYKWGNLGHDRMEAVAQDNGRCYLEG